jgi:aminocarboxymuconate-semialdehyde decarboxylase
VCDDPPFGSAAGIVDVHTHAIDPDLPTLAEHRGKSPQLVIERTDDVTARMLLDGKLYRTIDDRCWSPARRIADMDRSGVAAHPVAARAWLLLNADLHVFAGDAGRPTAAAEVG